LLSKWPIRRKLLLGLGLLVLVVSILSSAGLVATHAYRNLVDSLSWRVSELPLAAKLSRHVSDLRITIGELRGPRLSTFLDSRRDPATIQFVREQFRSQLDEVDRTLTQYRDQLSSEAQVDPRMSNHERERETLQKIENKLKCIRKANTDEDWMLDNIKIGWLDVELENLQILASELPSHLYGKMAGLSKEVQGRCGVLIASEWTAAVSAVLIFLLFTRLSYRWVFRPLQTLVAGSRLVAAGAFSYRIHLDTDDEMAELAKAMNDMTARFQEIRDDLDRQVQIRTRQAVRSEQLASVGFLAAGVAHEINNPLASIAMCAESLEGRIHDVLNEADPQQTVVANYLRMIQAEAFRCKGITEKLLDFSRMGPNKRENTELGELIHGVVEMLGHLGKYQRKHIDCAPSEPVNADVNPQEIKQVMLNLLTNALDSLDDGGRVRVELSTHEDRAVLTVADNGCGMEPQTLEHIFEPFFTRRRDGQGIGLGLSITYRIIADLGGDIEATSEGLGRGSTFRVRLPLRQKDCRGAGVSDKGAVSSHPCLNKEPDDRRKAA
jgi:two-component system, NtrC family, sensor kinase